MSLQRRAFLRATAGALVAAVAGPVAAQTAPRSGGDRVTTIGRSQGGQPLRVFHVGQVREGTRRILLIGGQHGSPEANSVQLADAILSVFQRDARALPAPVGLDILTVANPDGFIAGSRQLASGVDPNRNWATADWQSDAYDSLGRFRAGLGGPAPMSEPETRALADWVRRTRPALVVNYHSVGGFVWTSQTGQSHELGAAYVAASGYPLLGPTSDPWSYPITGAMDAWLVQQGIPNLFIELSTAFDAEVWENLRGLQAVIARLADWPPADRPAIAPASLPSIVPVSPSGPGRR